MIRRRREGRGSVERVRLRRIGWSIALRRCSDVSLLGACQFGSQAEQALQVVSERGPQGFAADFR